MKMKLPPKFSAAAKPIDFRTQLGSPFLTVSSPFLINARKELANIKDLEVRGTTAQKVVDQWLDMMSILDLVNEGNMLSNEEMAELTGLSKEEMAYLECIAYAENLGLEITDIEKAAIHYDIFGQHFPFQRHGGESFEFGGNISASERDLNSPG